MTLNIEIHEGGASWGVSANDPAIGGSVHAVGKTREAAVKEFRNALDFHLEGLREDGENVPLAAEIELREVVVV